VAKPLNKIKVVFCGDVRNNVSYAWMYGCAKMGMHYVAYGPDELINEIDKDVMEKVQAVAKETGAVIETGSKPDCIKGADAIYTDVWASMGEEDQIPERVRLLTPYRVTTELMEATENKDAIFLHCLPAFHDFETQLAKSQMELGYDIREVTDEVFRSKCSKVFDEAENRMHTIKAVLVATRGR
jgi:ornithine carbamoyltransferase